MSTGNLLIASNILSGGSYTISELNATFGDGKQKIPLLPTTPLNDRDANGVLKQDVTKTIIDSLIQQGIIPKYNGNNQKVLQEKQKQLIKNAEEEFQFYYVRYVDSLNTLFSFVNQYNVIPDDAIKTKIDEQIKITRILNKKLNDLIQIIIALTNYLQVSSQELQTQIQTLKDKLEKQKNTLAYQHKLMSGDDAANKLNKEMVKYTEEKAKYTNNLLNVYSVLNIVALGLLVYVFRSTV
jgi:ATP/maltotriose-dependent transcriptional regulator MalT